MLNLKGATKLLTDTEVLDNTAQYIHDHVGSEDWADHIATISGYLAVAIGWTEKEVVGYLTVQVEKE